VSDFEHAVSDLLVALRGRHLDVAVVADDGTVELVAQGHLTHAFRYENDADAALMIVSDMCAVEVSLRASRFIGIDWSDEGVTLRFDGRDVRLSLVPAVEPLSDVTLEDLLELHGTEE
jgi:hypothetical protein